MKVEVKENKVKPTRKYPYLGIRKESGAIVLFISELTGTTIVGGRHNKVGKFSESWYEPDFTLFEGTITLSND